VLFPHCGITPAGILRKFGSADYFFTASASLLPALNLATFLAAILIILPV
jgi:hypothetical protein